MFGKLKEKLKGALGVFSKKVEEEAETIEPVEEPIAEEKRKEEILEEEKEIIEEEKSANDLEQQVLEEKRIEKEKELEEIEKSKDERISDKKFEKEKEEISEIEQKEDVLAEKEKKIIETEEKLEKVIEDAPEEEKELLEAEKEIISKDLEEEKAEVEEEFEELEKERKEKKGFFKKVFGKKEQKEEAIEEEKLEPEEALKKEKTAVKTAEVAEEKKSFFGKVKTALTKRLSPEKFEELFFDIEIVLLENNISIEVIEKIKEDLKENMVGKPLSKTQILQTIISSIKQSIKELFEVPSIDIIEKSKEKKPLIISFVGVNGSGKTTNLAKVAKKLQDAGKTCVIAACDTFRAAAIQQLEEHANNLGIKIIKQDYGADAAAVAFDAIEHAKAKGIDAVLIDTAGRLHSNENLMKELEKLMRVANPDINIFVGESITGNDCVEQAKTWSNHVRIDGIILSKADVDDKGGAAISVSYVTKKPILYLGVGQDYNDLKEFDSKIILDSLEL